MTRTKSGLPSPAIKQLIPINQLISIPEGLPIPFDHLAIADLSTLPRHVTLVTFLGPSIKVLITKRAKLHVKVVYKVSEDDPLAQKYSVQAVVRAMSYTSEMASVDQEQARGLPFLTSASWKLPDEATRQFDLPLTMTGAQVLAAMQASDEFIVRTIEVLLSQELEPVKTMPKPAESMGNSEQ